MDSTSHSELLRWRDFGFDKFSMRSNKVLGDGNCLIHAICFSSYMPYHTGYVHGKRMTKSQIAQSFRYGLADRLTEQDPRTKNTIYDTLGLDVKNVPEYSLESLTSLFRGKSQLNMVSIFIIERLLNINIFILDSETKDVYVRDGKANRRNPCVVILYTKNHFDAISVEDKVTKRKSLYFKYKHPFIKHIEARIISRKQG